MPANDGTPRVWFSLLVPSNGGILVEHHALDYDHTAAAARMRQCGLPEGYAAALETGLWPTCDVLPPTELATRGQRLDPGAVFWPAPRASAGRAEIRWPTLPEFANGGTFTAWGCNPENLSQKKIGNLRRQIFTNAIEKMPTGSPFVPEILEKLIYDRKFDYGFERAFEHAVHLITIERLELRTAPRNFNFIFKSYADDDTYDALYSWAPYLLLFLAHAIFGLFDRMRNMEEGVKTAFGVRSLFAFTLLEGGAGNKATLKELNKMLSGVACDHCKAPLKVTFHNAGRILLTDSFRCASCRHKNLLAFSWAF
jgi:hypothetical protein